MNNGGCQFLILQGGGFAVPQHARPKCELPLADLRCSVLSLRRRSLHQPPLCKAEAFCPSKCRGHVRGELPATRRLLEADRGD